MFTRNNLKSGVLKFDIHPRLFTFPLRIFCVINFNHRFKITTQILKYFKSIVTDFQVMTEMILFAVITNKLAWFWFTNYFLSLPRDFSGIIFRFHSWNSRNGEFWQRRKIFKFCLLNSFTLDFSLMEACGLWRFSFRVIFSAFSHLRKNFFTCCFGVEKWKLLTKDLKINEKWQMGEFPSIFFSERLKTRFKILLSVVNLKFSSKKSLDTFSVVWSRNSTRNIYEFVETASFSDVSSAFANISLWNMMPNNFFTARLYCKLKENKECLR